MKFWARGIVAVTFLATISGLMGSNYDEFMRTYEGGKITSEGVVEMAWVEGAVQALRADGSRVNLKSPKVFALVNEMLWLSLADTVDIHARGLGQNINNPYFEQRVRDSLRRSLDELSRDNNQQQIALIKAQQDELIPVFTNRSFPKYKAFVRDYNGLVILPDNSVSTFWVNGALKALYRDGYRGGFHLEPIYNEVCRKLWTALEPIIQQDERSIDNPDFRENVWKSLRQQLERMRMQGFSF